MTVQSGRPDFPGTHFHIAGHDLHVVHLPQDRLGAILGLIARAKKSIQMFFYMFGDDATGREVRDALVAAANDGVHVQLIIDSFGSGNVSDRFFDALVEAGGCYHCFSARKGLGYIIRNHQKILIADRAHALVGGFNITDDYFGRARDNSWEDLGIIVSGGPSAETERLFRRFGACLKQWECTIPQHPQYHPTMASRHRPNTMAIGWPDKPHFALGDYVQTIA